jgi:uncharacterized protein YlxP (DUF503 family)
VAGFVGILHVDLHLPASTSLKEKRKELRRVKAWMTKGGYAVAETEHHDLWQRAAFVVAATARTPGEADERLEAASRRLHSDPVALVAGEVRQVVRAPELTDGVPGEELL